MISNTARAQVIAVFRALKYVRPYIGIYLLIMLFMILGGTMSSMPTMFMSKIDRFLPHVIDWAAAHGISDASQRPFAVGVVAFGGLYAILIMTSVVFITFQTFLNWYLGLRIALKMRTDFYEHLMSLPLSYFQKRPVGELMYRANTDIDASLPLVLTNVPTMISAIYNSAFYIYLLMTTGTTLVIPGLVLVALLFAFVHLLFTILRRLDYKWRVRAQELNATLRESVAGARVVKAFNKSRFEALKYFHRLGEFYRSNQRRFYLNVVIQQLQKSHIHTGYPLLYPLFGMLVLWSKIEAIQFIGLLLMCRATLYNFDMIYSQFQSIRTGMVPVQRLFETMDLPPAVAESPTAMPVKELDGRIEFDRVVFSYVPGTPILKDVSFALRPGQKLGIVGPSGAGKSTIASLLFRFWDPESGVVRIDGNDVRGLKMNTVLKQTGVILQNTHLFSGSIADNIRYGNPNATDAEVIAAAKFAGLHDDVMTFPDGYHTDVGEGEKLSGGQRQRVSIARALVKKPRLLVLDEPTASLDPRTALTIGTTLKQISANMTTLIISHRLSDVEDSDMILAIDGGRIAEQGTHAELLARDGLYASLHRQQQISQGGALEGDGHDNA